MVDDAIEEQFQMDFEEQTIKEANDLVWREWKLAFDINGIGLPILYSDSAARSCNKAFRVIFAQKYIDIYKKAYEIAEHKYRILKEETGEDKYPDKDFHNILIEELKATENLESDKIVKIFDYDFVSSIEKNFSNFKDYICWRMRSTNTRRKKWACWNLEEIQNTFEGESLNEHKRKLLDNAQDQIQKAFDDYEAEITDTYENYEVPFEYFCISNTVVFILI